MTDEEIKKLAEEIVKQRGGFYVEPEEHYQQHQRLEKMLDFYDSTSSVVLKVLIGAAVTGIFILAAIGLGWGK